MDQGVSRLSAEIIVRRIPVVPGERLQRDQLRSYKIIIDGAERGRIRAGETRSFSVTPGEHAIHLRISWCSSQALKATVSSNETVIFGCGPGGMDPLTAITTGRKSYIALWPLAAEGL